MKLFRRTTLSKQGSFFADLQFNTFISTNELKILVFLLLGLFFFYLSMFLSYRPYDIDNPWFLSFSYNRCVEHIGDDQFMSVRFPAGMDGTQYFGKIAAFVQCGLLSYTGWAQWPAAMLSSASVTLALGFWWLQLRKLGHSVKFAACFLVVVGMSDPILASANKFRYEFLSFTLISLALLLLSYGKPLWSVFVAGAAVEIEPVAIIGLLAVLILAFHLYEKMTVPLFGQIIAGLSLAAVTYVCLHPQALSFSRSASFIAGKGIYKLGGFFASYFIERYRHLPELICFGIAGIYYWKKHLTFDSNYLGNSALYLTCASILMPHGNVAYMIFLYPFLVAMLLAVLDAERRFWGVILLNLLYVIPQYGYLVYISRNHGYRPQDIRQVSDTIFQSSRQLALDDRNLRIYGDYGLWFAHPHLYRAAASTTEKNIQDADLYICYVKPIQPYFLTPRGMFYCPDIQNRVSVRLLSKIAIRDQILYFYTKN